MGAFRPQLVAPWRRWWRVRPLCRAPCSAIATAALRSAARGLKRHRESRKHPSHGGPLRFLPEEHRSEAEKNREYTFQPDEAVEAIKAPQVILSKAHKEYRTRKSRGQKQGNVDELISMPETLAEAVWV